MSKMAIFQKSYFCPKMSVFGQNGPKIMFCPTLHFYIMPNLKVHIFSFVMMCDVGVCRGRTLSRPKMLFRRSPIGTRICLFVISVVNKQYKTNEIMYLGVEKTVILYFLYQGFLFTKFDIFRKPVYLPFD